ncbi:MAG: hypothetical protein JWQ16_2230 [Novosphingobium sp.]|nr:hypothetical protein [Novosphingobium sp.]
MTNRKLTSAAFTRPANTTAYAAGDIVANSATAGSVVVPALAVSPIPGAAVKITRVLISKTNPVLTNAQFRVHLFLGAPVVSSGDNAAINIAGVAATPIGTVDVTVDQAYGDGSLGDAVAALVADLADGVRQLFAVIEALAAYTPTSGETFTLTLETERD